MDTISGKDERHADRKAPAILSHKDGSAEWADKATTQKGAARTDAAGGRAAEAGTAREREGRPEPLPEPETKEPHGAGTGSAACPGAVDGDGAAGRRGPKRKKGPDALSGPLRRRLPALPLPQYHRRDGA